MDFTLFSFKSRPKPEPKTIAQRNKEFWHNELQCLSAVGGNEVVCVRGRDIECVWTESNGKSMWKTYPDGHTEANPEYKPHYMISTKGGQKFELTHDSWFKCRFEDPEWRDDS